MASFYWNTFLCLFLLTRLSSVLSALYPTEPVADTIFYCGSFALVTWVDTRHKPHVAGLGNLTIKLHTSQDVCASADGLYSCSSARICTGLRDYAGIGRESSFVQYTGDSSAGSSERHAIVSLDLLFVRNWQSPVSVLRFSAPGLWEDVWTADFTILPEDARLGPRPMSVSSSLSTATLGPTQLEGEKQTSSSILPVSTITLDGSSSPPRRNGAVHGRADQLDTAQFRLLFIVWPALFGLCMALWFVH